jgi:D-alanyl-D-alanine carboxypeptidase
MKATDAKEIDTAAQAAFASLAGKAPGMYVDIWDPKEGVYRNAFGVAQIGGTNATVGDSVRIGSMTNTYTATVILQLVRERKLALADTVNKRAPKLAGQIPELEPITVRQLLSMSSGLPDYLERPGGAIAEIVANPQRIWTPEELISEGVKLGVKPPGTPGYSTTNFVVLQVIAETVTGTKLADLIKTRITEPLGLRHTELPPNTDTTLPAPVAHGYLNQGCVAEMAADGAPGVAPNTETTDWNVSYAQGAGGMTSTIADMGVWADTTMGTTSLSKALGNLRIRTRNLGTGLQYGLGLIRFGDWLGHAGEGLGWESLALHDPKTGVTFVAAANACNGTTDAFIALLKQLYPGTTPS